MILRDILLSFYTRYVYIIHYFRFLFIFYLFFFSPKYNIRCVQYYVDINIGGVEYILPYELLVRVKSNCVRSPSPQKKTYR